MESVHSWLKSVPQLKDGYQLDEGSAARGKFSICCHVTATSDVKRDSFILKRSIIGEMDSRGGSKWVRDIQSLAAEFNFYEQYRKITSGGQSSIPIVIDSFSNFDEKTENPKDLFEDQGEDFKPRDDLVFAILMEDLGASKGSYQLTNGLTVSHLPDFIQSLAQFHSETAKIKQHLNENSSMWSIGGFWTKDKRQDFDKEVSGIPGRWEEFYKIWSHEIIESIDKDTYGIIKCISQFLKVELEEAKQAVKNVIPSLGLELSKHCDKVSKVVEEEPRMCIVHGDNKVANIFYSPESEVKFKWIDFQWAGLGSPTLDLVYLIASSVQNVEILETQLENLLTTY